MGDLSSAYTLVVFFCFVETFSQGVLYVFNKALRFLMYRTAVTFNYYLCMWTIRFIIIYINTYCLFSLLGKQLVFDGFSFSKRPKTYFWIMRIIFNF